MIPDGNIINNVTRFSGFESEYDRYRPKAPEMVVELLNMYLGRNPSIVLDLGCGTGLSSFIWKDRADQIIGVEPNDDMRRKAQDTLSNLCDANHISFVQGFSNQLDIDPATVDVITCSQSFHWMEPVSTLEEVSRVLCEGGIFAAYDCDWPPSVHWKIEKQYTQLMDKVECITRQHATEESIAKKWPKDEHLKNMRNSKAFRFTKEIVFHSREQCDAERYVGLAISQGGLQTVLKAGWTDLNQDIESFRKTVEEHFGRHTLDVVFSYRMRVGIK